MADSVNLSPASLALGAGTATAVMMPSWMGSEAIGFTVAGAYAASQALDGDTLDVVALPTTGAGDEVDRALRVGVTTLGWVAVHAFAVPVLRWLPLPRPVVAVVAGYAVAEANERFAQVVG